MSLNNLRVVSGPQNGTLTIENDGLRYSPDLDFSGTDSFVYAIGDADGLEAQAMVEITVGETLIPPVIPGNPLTLLQRADVNGDRSISALDALLTINFLNRQETSTMMARQTDEAVVMDVTGDGVISALDALVIINLLNRSSAAGESVQVTADLPTSSSDPTLRTTDEDKEARFHAFTGTQLF